MTQQTAEALLKAARAAQPGLMARAAEFEAARRLPADVAQELAAMGACRMLTPASIGGPQHSVRSFAEALEALAIGDASASWCAMIASTNALNAAFMPTDAAREVFGDPMAITGGVVAPMGRAVPEGEGYRVSGKWQWGSGSANCSWMAGGCLIEEEGGVRRLPSGAPDAPMMIFPAAEVELIDSWHVAGLKGTGSGEFMVRDVFVPKTRAVHMASAAPVAEGALYAFPLFGLLAVGVSAVAMGNARGALNAIRDLTTRKSLKGSARVLAERQVVQREIAMAEANFRAARAYLFDEIDRVWEVAQTTGEIPLERRADIRLAATHMTRTAAETARIAYDVGGGAAVFLENQLQRRFRDAHVATQHIATSAATFEGLGRVLLGQPTEGAMI